MAQIALKVFTVFCGIGGPNIAPFILPLINIPLLISSFIPIMLIVMLGSDVNVINSVDDGNGNKIKNWNKGSGFAFLIYYLIFLILGCSVMHSACKAGRATGLV